MRFTWLVGTLVLGIVCSARAVHAASLSAADFTFTLSRIDGDGRTTTLTDDELKTFFSSARCACPTSVVAQLAFTSSGTTNVGSSTVDAQIEVGSDCDNSSASGCATIGSSLTLSSSKTSTSETISSSSFFNGGSCSTTATATRAWAVIRQDGARLDAPPSLVINLGGTGPTAPTTVKAQSADEGTLVSWTATGDSTTIQGHQVLCSPALASPPTAAYDTCAALPAAGGDGSSPFATLDAKFVCSSLVAVGTNSVRVKGLTNGQAYQVAVVAVGIDGTASKASSIVTVTPAPTYGFDDLYRQNGGTAAGCAVAPSSSSRGGLCVAVALMIGAARRRRSRRWLVRAAGAGVVLAALAAPARAQTYAEMIQSSDASKDSTVATKRGWNLELRFGPYRPDVDSEFAARGSTARPYRQIFSSSRRLMTQLEIDRQMSRRGGIWALGVSVGYLRASGSALEADLTTASGDSTSLTLIPLSLSAVYRADAVRQIVGIEPYAKLGLDCTVWSFGGSATSNAASSGTTGRTLGWHAAAGLSLDLAALDPEASDSMAAETGIKQTALFAEVARYALDGFGSSSALHVGDLTWFGGLMLEF